MKASELRIGNLISRNKTTQEVISIFTYMDNTPTLMCAPFERETEITEFEPIPLTEEWLVNFGFDRSSVRGDKHFYKQVADRFLRLSIGDFWNVHIGQAEIKYYEIPVNIKYVHQLQNLYFALTGEELTIKQ